MILHSSNFDVTNEPHTYADIDDLYQRLGVQKNGIYLVQNKEFIEWMLYNSKNDCHRYFAYSNGRLAGYIYLCALKQQMVSIIDFAFEDGKAAKFLLKRVLSDLANRGATFIKISINVRHRVHKKYLASLMANGFVPLYYGGSHVTLPLLYTNKEILNDMSRWYLTDLWYLLYNREKDTQNQISFTHEAKVS
jgi:hypothetical protein